MADLPPEMLGILGELKNEGKVDSSGIFTLDLSKAIDKLSVYQLPQQYFYIPKMVQAAVAGGATFVQARINETRVLIEFDGHAYGEDELRNLFSYLFSEKDSVQHRHRRHMATAINTAVALEARAVRIESGRGDAVVRQRWMAHNRNEIQKVEKPWPAHEVRTRFLLYRSLSDMSSKWWHTAGKVDVIDLLTKHQRAMTPEQQELLARVPYCPIPVFLNGRRLNFPRFGEPPFGVGLDRLLNTRNYNGGRIHRQHHLVERYISLNQAGPPQLGAPVSTASHTETVVRQPGEAPCPALLALEMGLYQHEKLARLVFVLDGVIVGQKAVRTDTYGAVGVVGAEGLSFDLSQFSIAEDERFHDRLAWLKTQFRELHERLKQKAENGELSQIPSDLLQARLTW